MQIRLPVGLIAIAALGLMPTHAQENCDDPTNRTPLKPDAVPENLEARAHAALDRIQHPQSRKEVEDRRTGLRDKLKQSLGYNLLPWPPDLRTAITGTVQRPGYRIEKLAFQTLPDVMMTAQLYVPDGIGAPVPAVLFWSGHSMMEGKLQADAQTFAIAMVRRGFVVLAADSIGTGERIADRKIHHPEALLVGLSEAGIDEYETRCALEFLASRKEVDAKRIGMTGVDDGGFNTWVTAALEDRVAAAVPVDSTYDFGDRIHRMRAVDWNGADLQSDLVPGILKFANIQELVAIVAPRGVLMIDGPRAHGIYDYGTQIYGSFGDNSRIRLFESEGNGYDKPRRQSAYGFFLRILKGEGDGTPVDEPAMEVSPADAPELQCLPKGSHISASTGISETVRRLAVAAESRTQRESVEALAGTAPAGAKISWCLRTVPVTMENFVVEQGVSIPATALRPGFKNGGGLKGWLIAIDDEKKESLESDPIVQEAMRRDYIVWELDPRGFGELLTELPSWQFATGVLLGDNLIWRQAWDIHAVVDSFCAPGSRGSVGLYARGPNSSLAATYAIKLLSASCLDWAVLKGGYVSLRQLLDMPAVIKSAVAGQSLPYDDFAFGALLAPDLPQLMAPARAHTFLIDPIDPQLAHAAQSDRVRVATMDEFLGTNW